MPGTIAIIWAVLAALFAATIAITVATHGRCRVPADKALPRVSIIVPIKGANPFLAENIERLAHLDVHAGEVLLAIADPDDDAAAILSPLVARYPDRLKLLSGEAADFANPKLRNFAKAWRTAAEDTVLFLDDNVALDAALYRELVGALDERHAAATAAHAGREARGLPAEIEAATCNGYIYRIERALELFGGAAAFGSALAVDRRRLDAAGGLASLDEGPCEDNALSKALRRAGHRVTLVALPVNRRIGRRSWQETALRHLRWKNCAKCHDPILFLLEPLVGGFCFMLFGAIALADWLGVSWIAGLGVSAALWYGGEVLLHGRCRWRVSPLSPLAWVLRDLLQPVVTLWAAMTRGVSWRGVVIDTRLRRRPSGG